MDYRPANKKYIYKINWKNYENIFVVLEWFLLKLESKWATISRKNDDFVSVLNIFVQDTWNTINQWVKDREKGLTTSI